MLGVVALVCIHIALRTRQNNHLELIRILMTAVIQTMYCRRQFYSYKAAENSTYSDWTS